MPLYEYKCEKCGVFEILQKLKEEPLNVCPTCNSKIEKIISVPGQPVFNGTGFFYTDYVKPKQPKREET